MERVFAQYMVPHNLETAERMKCLYYLYATLDTNAVKYVLLCFFFYLFHCCVCFHLTSVSFSLRALNEMWKCQNMLRNHVKDLLDLVKKPKVGLLQPENVIFTESCLLHFLTILLFYVHYLQSETSSKAVFAKVMVITSK